jgi:hypothetical protein
MNKTVQRAQELKAEGKIYMASVVKSVYDTVYYHVVPIDRVIVAGKWIPANGYQLMLSSLSQVRTDE